MGICGSIGFKTPCCCSRWQQAWQILLGVETVAYAAILAAALLFDICLKGALLAERMPVQIGVCLSLNPIATIVALTDKLDNSDSLGFFSITFVLRFSLPAHLYC